MPSPKTISFIRAASYTVKAKKSFSQTVSLIFYGKVFFRIFNNIWEMVIDAWCQPDVFSDHLGQLLKEIPLSMGSAGAQLI